jgi:hypothetical protein
MECLSQARCDVNDVCADLFPESPRLVVRLERAIDRARPCCGNYATIHSAPPPHVAELRCERCDRHRGWLAREAYSFIKQTVQEFGHPVEPIILRDQTGHPRESVMNKTYDNTNSGVLFRNDRKESAKHADYKGEINAAGVEFWVDAWVRTSSKNGSKFFSFKLRPKKEAAKAKPAFNDAIPI